MNRKQKEFDRFFGLILFYGKKLLVIRLSYNAQGYKMFIKARTEHTKEFAFK